MMFISVLFLLPFAFTEATAGLVDKAHAKGETSNGDISGGICGSPNDPCMTRDNWEICSNLKLLGCQNIAKLESCPVQFTCQDKSTDGFAQAKDLSSGLLRKRPASFVVPPDASRASSISKENEASVSLYVYKDIQCNGSPLRVEEFPTRLEPGSPCYHDVSMNGISVKDQYCNMETGNFHQTVYVGSETCTEYNHWWYKVQPFSLTYTTDGCVFGFRLKNCTKLEEIADVE